MGASLHRPPASALLSSYGSTVVHRLIKGIFPNWAWFKPSMHIIPTLAEPFWKSTPADVSIKNDPE